MCWTLVVLANAKKNRSILLLHGLNSGWHAIFISTSNKKEIQVVLRAVYLKENQIWMFVWVKSCSLPPRFAISQPEWEVCLLQKYYFKRLYRRDCCDWWISVYMEFSFKHFYKSVQAERIRKAFFSVISQTRNFLNTPLSNECVSETGNLKFHGVDEEFLTVPPSCLAMRL